MFKWMEQHPLFKKNVSVCAFLKGSFSPAVTQCSLLVEKIGRNKPAPRVKCPEITVVVWPYATKVKLNINKTSGK